MFTLDNLDVVGGMLKLSFFPVILPVMLFVASVIIWAYYVSKGTIKENWRTPAIFLGAALILAVIAHL